MLPKTIMSHSKLLRARCSGLAAQGLLHRVKGCNILQMQPGDQQLACQCMQMSDQLQLTPNQLLRIRVDCLSEPDQL